MNPFREAPMKIKYTMSKNEILEACQDWLCNNKGLHSGDVDGLILLAPDSSEVMFVEAVLELED